MLILHQAGLYHSILGLSSNMSSAVTSFPLLQLILSTPSLKKENVWEWAAVGTLTVSDTITNNSYLAPIASPLKKKKWESQHSPQLQ